MLKALQDLRISLRIITFNLLLLLLLALVAISGYLGMERVATSNDTALQRRAEMANLRMLQLYLKNMYNYQVDYIYNNDPVAAQAFRNTIAPLQDFRKKIRAILTTEDQRLNLNIIDRQTDQFILLFLEKIDPLDQPRGNSTTLNQLNEQSKELISQTDPFIQNMIAEFEKRAEEAYQSAQDTKSQTILIVIGLSVLSIIIGLGSGLLLAQTLSNGAHQIVLAAEQMRNAEEALRESESIFGHVVRAAPWGMHFYQYHSDGQLVLIDANPAADAILGVEHKTLIGKTIEDAFPGLRQTDVPLRYREVAHTGNSWNAEQVAYDHDTVHSAFEVHAFQISAERMVAAFLDIAERKRIELEREQLLRELDRKNNELESIVYAASHDLRSPLLNVMGFGKLLQSASQDLRQKVEALDLPPEKRQEFQGLLEKRIPQALHFITTSASKMDVLINGLLRLSRLGRAALFIEELNMDHLLQSVIDAMHFQIEKAEAKIIVEHLPDCKADAAQINQVFTNLLDNALKYRDPARPLQITISSQPYGKHIVYTMEDNGLGIAQEHQEKIWDLFHRLDPTGAVPGEGLGLTLVVRILDRNNGRAWVESQPGKGSKFYVALPASQHEEPQANEST
jgi:PAS domain S-box-containing protein